MAFPATATKVKYPYNLARDISEVEPYRRRLADVMKDGRDIRMHWSAIEENQFPGRCQWLHGDSEDIHKRAKEYSGELLNNTVLSSRRIIASALQNGLTPSGRDWHEIHPEDENLRDDSEVTWYLSRLKARANQLLRETNFYPEVYGVYEDVPTFGIAAMLMEDDDERLLNFVRLPTGSFWPETDARNDTIGLVRKYAMSCESMLHEFGDDALPERLRQQLHDGHYYHSENIYQFIRPVDPEDRDAPAWAGYECVYFLETKGEGEDKLLARRYYRVRPFLVFRWSVDAGSAYGLRCPGMDALGDCKQLQAMERKKLRAIDMSIDPPLAVKSSLKGYVNRRPGTITFVEDDESIKQLMNVNYRINDISADIANVEQRIRKAHFEDVFLSMLSTPKQMTAEEARQRNEERTMVTGPIIERFTFDMLDSLMNRLIDAIMFNQLAPPPPEQLQGNIKFTFSGPLTMVMEAAKLENVTAWMRLCGELAATLNNPDPLDRVDGDEVVEVAARVLSIDEAMLVPAEEAKQLRSSRAQAQQQAQAAQGMMAMAQGAGELSKAQFGDGNLLEAAAGMTEGMQ